MSVGAGGNSYRFFYGVWPGLGLPAGPLGRRDGRWGGREDVIWGGGGELKVK